MSSLLTAVRDLDRLRQIAGVLARHGFGELLARTGFATQLGLGRKTELPSPGTLGQRVRMALTELGPSFIKLGQILSTRPDLLPTEIVDELSKLQDEVPPVPFAEVRPMLERELGLGIDEIYESLDEAPLASASIAQVYRAKLRVAGEPARDVVVKLQRPNIKDVIERDLDLLHLMARAIERSIPESRLYAPCRLVGEFDRAITAELDFALEADNAERFAKNFRSHEDGIVRFPAVYRQASSRRVLTLEFLPGQKVLAAVAGGANGAVIARNAVAILVKQVFEDGFFHADPHPGNIIIQGPDDAPVIALVDLGLVGRLTPELRDKTVDLMVAAASEDPRAMADALCAIGVPSKKVDRRQFEAEVATLADKYLGKKLKDVAFADLLRDLVHGSQKYGMEVPPDFLLVGKALMTVEGIGKQIYPELDVLQEVKPYFLRLMWLRYSPEKLSHELLRNVTRMRGLAADMPLQLAEILDDLKRGELSITTSDRALPSALDRLGRRVFSGAVVSVCILAGAYLVGQGRDTLGVAMLAIGIVWASAHTALVAWLGRTRRP